MCKLSYTRYHIPGTSYSVLVHILRVYIRCEYVSKLKSAGVFFSSAEFVKTHTRYFQAAWRGVSTSGRSSVFGRFWTFERSPYETNNCWWSNKWASEIQLVYTAAVTYRVIVVVIVLTLTPSQKSSRWSQDILNKNLECKNTSGKKNKNVNTKEYDSYCS